KAAQPDLLGGDAEDHEAEAEDGDHDTERGAAALDPGAALPEHLRGEAWVLGRECLLHLLKYSLLVLGERHGDLLAWSVHANRVADGWRDTEAVKPSVSSCSGYDENVRCTSRGSRHQAPGGRTVTSSRPFGAHRSSTRPPDGSPGAGRDGPPCGPGWPVAARRCRTGWRPGPPHARRRASRVPARPGGPGPGCARPGSVPPAGPRPSGSAPAAARVRHTGHGQCRRCPGRRRCCPARCATG